MTALLHPLLGCRLAADGCTSRDGELLLTVTLPDQSRALMLASETDVFGTVVAPVVGGTVLSVTGVRRLQALLAGAGALGRVRRRPWKVVRHAPGADVFVACEEVCSTHASEEMAVRARARAKAQAVRRDKVDAKRWAWSVVCDHGGLLGAEGGGAK